MKRILILDAGLKPGWTKKTADAVADKLQAAKEFEIDRVSLRDEAINPCKGCALCLERGEEVCRFHDDSASGILERMMLADGIVTVTPNYSLQVPGILKTLYDRLAFVFHRPRLFGKVSLTIVVQGVFGGKKILKYVDELMSFWGCSIVKGAVVSGGLYPNSTLADTVLKKNDKLATEALGKFMNAVMHYKERKPSFFRLAIFRMTRSSMKYSDEALAADRAYYLNNGWLDSRYYTNVKLGPIQLLAGALIDKMIKGMVLQASINVKGEGNGPLKDSK